MSFFAELKRRNVFKVGAAYVIVSWLLIQVVSIVVPSFKAPDWVMPICITLISIGFPLALILAWAYELTPEGIKPTESVDLSDSITHHTGRKLDFIIIGLMALAISFLVVDNYVLKKSPKVTMEPATQTVAMTAGPSITNVKETVPAAPRNSIAVLPFANMSANKDQDYFADGLTEELLNKLSQVKDLQVAGRTSSFYFKGKNEDLRKIGETLGVAYLLEGSVRKDGNQLRITAQLVKAIDGYHLWSETYDRELSGIFAIQDEIAQAVTTALSVTLGAGAFNRPGMTRNIEAYEAYLQGMAEFNKQTPQSLLTAIEYFEQAVQLDPNFAMGWVRLVDLYGGPNNSLFTPQQSIGFSEKARVALEHAQSIDPTMPEVLNLTAYSKLLSGDVSESERIYQGLIEDYGHSNAMINRNYGILLLVTGRSREALSMFQRAVLIDPLEGFSYNMVAAAFFAMDQRDKAITAAEEGMSHGGGGTTILNIYEWLIALMEGNYATAGQKIAEFYDLQGDYPNETMLGIGRLLKSGDNNAVIIEIRKAATDPNTSAIIRDNLIRIATVLGENQLVLDMLSEGRATPIPVWEPQSKQLRQSQEFKSYIRESGRLEYWRTSGHWPDACHPVDEDDFECE